MLLGQTSSSSRFSCFYDFWPTPVCTDMFSSHVCSLIALSKNLKSLKVALSTMSFSGMGYLKCKVWDKDSTAGGFFGGDPREEKPLSQKGNIKVTVGGHSGSILWGCSMKHRVSLPELSTRRKEAEYLSVGSCSLKVDTHTPTFRLCLSYSSQDFREGPEAQRSKILQSCIEVGHWQCELTWKWPCLSRG